MEQKNVWCQLEQRMEATETLWYMSASKCPSACSSTRWDAGEELPLLGVPVFLGYRAGQDMLAHPGLWDTAVVRTHCLSLCSPRDLQRVCGKPELLQLLETPQFQPKPLNSKTV